MVALDIPDISATYEAVDAAIMRTDNTSEIAGLGEETSPAATDLFLLELASDGSKAKISYDDLATAINPGDGSKIILDDTQVTITDDGVADGQVDIIVDGTTVLTATADGITMGPLAATAALTANNTYSSNSLITGFNAGETISQWQTVYYDGTAAEWMLADADASGKWPSHGIAVAASTNGNAIDVMPQGLARYDTWDWTPGAALCLSTTAGGIVACTGTNARNQVIGFAKTADIAYFNFEQPRNDILHGRWSFDPKAVCDGAVDRLFLMTADDGLGRAMRIVKWKLSFEADPTTEAAVDLKRADAFIGVANSAVMDVLDTTNGVSSESTAANINAGAAVANGKVVYLCFTDTPYTEANHQVIFEMWYHYE